MPFEKNSFALVYTSLALEQMERIKKFCEKFIVFVEDMHLMTFKEYNNKFPSLAYVISQDYFRDYIRFK